MWKKLIAKHGNLQARETMTERDGGTEQNNMNHFSLAQFLLCIRHYGKT